MQVMRRHTAPPLCALSCNIVGGLGNQLFLLATLVATGRRAEDKAAQIEDSTRPSMGSSSTGQADREARKVAFWVQKEKWSSSVFDPRPTYWDTLFKETPTLIGESEPNHPGPSKSASGGSLSNMFRGLSKAATAEEDRSIVVDPTCPPFTLEQKQTVPETRPVAPIELPFLNSEQGGTSRTPPSISPSSPITVPNYNLVGFFQSEAYFKDYKEEVVQLLRPDSLYEQALDFLSRRYGSPTEHHLVALHVRRGDYLQLQETFAILDHHYYDSAMRLLFGPQLIQRRSNPKRGSDGTKGGGIKVLIFSEDKPYASTVKGWLLTKYPALSAEVVTTTSGGSTSDPGSPDRPSELPSMPNDVLELLMMSHCHDVVMANSSYSWWGAYFNETPLRRVVAPSKWFVEQPYPQSSHLYADGWIVV